MVPRGIERDGFFRSPDSPTPAVIPVNAGKQIANTTKKPSGSLKLDDQRRAPSWPATGCPRKNRTSDTARTAHTTYSAPTPRSAPLVSIRRSNATVIGTEM